MADDRQRKVKAKSSITVYDDNTADIHFEGTANALYYGLAQYIIEMMDECDPEGVHRGIRIAIETARRKAQEEAILPEYDGLLN